MIRDLLPLYLDEVCSAESREIVEDHLEHCTECTSYFRSMTEADEEEEQSTLDDAERECQKASSFRAIKKRIAQKQVLAAAIAILAIVLIGMIVAGILKKTVRVVPYQNNLSVSMVDGSLVGRLYGSEFVQMKAKTVFVNQNGKEYPYIFYQVTDTAWNDFITSKNVFSEYVVCPKEKSADAVEGVYYYTGDYAGLENMSDADLQSVMEASKLLWSKNG